MGGTLSRPVVDGIGIVFPAYQTLLCLEDGCAQAEKDHWLRYWAVFGAFRVVEYLADRLVMWTPLYYPAKVALLVAMINPKTEVKEKLFEKVVLPFVRRHRGRIDDSIALGTKKVQQAWALAWEYAMRVLRAFLAAVWFSDRPGGNGKPQPSPAGVEAHTAVALVPASGAPGTPARSTSKRRRRRVAPAVSDDLHAIDA